MGGLGVTFTDGEIQRAAEKMVAEFGDTAEHEVKARGERARARGLAVTASVWDRILGVIEKQRDDGEASRDLEKAR